MSTKPIVARTLYYLRNLSSRQLFGALRRFCRGSVLDVGGWDFYESAQAQHVPFDAWTALDLSDKKPPTLSDSRIQFVVGDGCSMSYADCSFDTVLSIQVLEHVFEPNRMVNELCRVLKPDGHLIMLVPQTSTIHMVPHHYYNFTRFWILEAMRRNRMEIVDLKPLGGVWRSMASHLVFFFFQGARCPGLTSAECTRNLAFYLLFPFMAVFALLALPICLLLSLGDLTEEPNNHLVIARKPKKTGPS
jgi:SAM-dependent methyltransferase